MDRTELDRLVVGISAFTKSEPGWPPLARFKVPLVTARHNLSDVCLAEVLGDWASFRRFFGFSAHEPTLERTAFVRFPAELVRRGLDRTLFAAISCQLDHGGFMGRTGTLVGHLL